MWKIRRGFLVMLCMIFISAMPALGAGKKVSSIKINQRRIDLKVNQSYKLKASVKPANAKNKRLRWESGDPAIATVNSQGKVTGKSQGMTLIHAFATDGSHTTSYSCSVFVKGKAKAKKIKITKDNIFKYFTLVEIPHFVVDASGKLYQVVIEHWLMIREKYAKRLLISKSKLNIICDVNFFEDTIALDLKNTSYKSTVIDPVGTVKPADPWKCGYKFKKLDYMYMHYSNLYRPAERWWGKYGLGVLIASDRSDVSEGKIARVPFVDGIHFQSVKGTLFLLK